MTAVALEAVFLLLLILSNGMLAMSEMAVVAARRPRLRKMADEGNEGAATALELAGDPGPFLATAQIGITLVGILIGAFGGAALSDAIAERLVTIDMLVPYAEAVAIGLVVLLLTYLTLVLGELVPKQIALRQSARIASVVAAPMSFLARIAAPLVALLSVSADAILRILRQGPSGEPAVAEEDVRIMLQQGAELGVFKPMEEEIVGQVFRLADQRIGALITPRTEIVWIEETDSPEIVRQKVVSSGRSRFPVAKENLDQVTGVVLAKDLLAQCLYGRTTDIAAIRQPALFVPENMPALSVVERFKETRAKIAMVIDEYGGVEGLVTINDVLQALVGEIPELEEPDEPRAIQRSDGSWLVDGLFPLADLQDAIGLSELPVATKQYYTVGGMVMALLGRLPIAGDRVRWQGFWIEVVDMDVRRVDKVLVTKAGRDGPDESEP